MTAAVPFLYARGGSLFALSTLREALSLLVGGVEEEGMKLFLRRTCKEAEVELHVAAEVDRMAPLNVDWTRGSPCNALTTLLLFSSRRSSRSMTTSSRYLDIHDRLSSSSSSFEDEEGRLSPTGGSVDSVDSNSFFFI